MVAASLEGGIDIIQAAIARAWLKTDVWRAHEVSSFTFMHSKFEFQTSKESARDVEVSDDFVMVDPNFQATNVRWSGTPRAAAFDLEVPPGAT